MKSLSWKSNGGPPTLTLDEVFKLKSITRGDLQSLRKKNPEIPFPKNIPISTRNKGQRLHYPRLDVLDWFKKVTP